MIRYARLLQIYDLNEDALSSIGICSVKDVIKWANTLKEGGMNKQWEDVRQFHEKFGHPVSDTPVAMSLERAEKRYKWMKEEIDEFIEAVKDGDIVEQADAMIDTIYFALGTLVEMGIRPDALFDIVQEANMSKLFPDGKPHYNEDGKTIKPDTWEDPHEKLEDAINKEMI